jgi:hypothetical protein
MPAIRAAVRTWNTLAPHSALAVAVSGAPRPASTMYLALAPAPNTRAAFDTLPALPSKPPASSASLMAPPRLLSSAFSSSLTRLVASCSVLKWLSCTAIARRSPSQLACVAGETAMVGMDAGSSATCGSSDEAGARGERVGAVAISLQQRLHGDLHSPSS